MQYYTLNFGAQGSQLAATNFDCILNGFRIQEMQSHAVNLPTSLNVPGGGSYSFAYEPTYGESQNTTERLSQITLPTGGYTNYTYTGGQGINCTDLMTVPTVKRTVTDITTVGGSGSGVWTYTNTAGINSTNLSETVGVTLPDNTSETYQFSNLFKTSKTAGSIVEIVCYNGAALANCRVPPSGFGVTYPIKELNTYISLDSSSNEETDITLQSGTNTPGDGLPTEIDRYDFGPSKTSVEKIGYGSMTSTWNCSNSAMAANEIFDRVCYDALLKSDGATTVSYKDATYDAKGNKLSSRVATVGTTTFLPTTFVNNSNGTVAQITEPNQAMTKFDYTGTGECSGLLLTSTTFANGLSSSQQWDCNGGVVTNQTEVSNATVHYDYVENTPDPLWRVKEFTDEALNDTTYSYASVTSSESNLTFGSSTQDILTTLDSLGRKILAQKKQGPSATQYDTVRTTYDAMGRVSTVSAPYSCALPCNSLGTAVTTQTYDSSGRPYIATDPDSGTITKTYNQNTVISTVGPTPTVTRQLQYDGLGRLASVCEVSAQTGNGTCGQHTTAKGFVTAYLYREDGKLLQSTQNATQTRSFTYDNAGRMLTESNPESGTTQYFWDTSTSVCGGYTSNGDLMEKRDNSNVSICYGYDSLHRLLGFGPSNSTKCTGLVYDAPATGWPAPSGSNLQNTTGRLIEAYTNSVCDGHPSIVTDKWFGYSLRGEFTDIYTKTPNSDGYYHLSKGYAANGVVNSLAGIPGVPTITYGLDGEGRWNSVTGGSSALSSTAYNPAGQPTTLTFPSGDTDVYGYDPAGRMKTYTFKVNGQSLIGTLTWNANGTLKQIWTQDPFNSAMNNVTVGYTYDDLGRAATAIGGTWSQNFSYDPFGNITKTGSSSWACATCYNTATNQYNATLSNQITYDANGNLTYDTFHHYQWDANGHVITNDGSTFTYDADGYMAEASWGDQYLYDTNGSLLAGSNAQGTAYLARVPLPGGAIANYSGGTLNSYQHADWLGSVRLSTTVPGRASSYDVAFAPFGEPYASTHVGNSFAGMTQVEVADEYDTPNREYHTTQGRWITPDPAGLAAVDPTNPQSWNRYAYVLNNPLASVDPTGLDCIHINNDTGAYEGFESGDCDNSTEEKANSGYYVDGTVDTIYTTTGTDQGVVTGYSGTGDSSNIISGNLTPFGGPSGDTLNSYAQAVFSQPVLGYARNTVQNYMAPPLLAFLSFAVPGALAAGGPETTIGGTVVIGKVSDLENGAQPGENPLDLPNQGNPKDNWAQNSSKLRQAMSEGKPIRDVSAGDPASNTGFLRAERNLLETQGWTLQGEYWVPPGY